VTVNLAVGKRFSIARIVIAVVIAASGGEVVTSASEDLPPQEQTIPILGVTLSYGLPIGTVTSLTVTFQERQDAAGLMLVFLRGPGRLSPRTQTSIQQAIYRAARAANLSTDSWTITISVPSAVTIHGDSLSAMVGLTVVALAKRDPIRGDVIITGGVAPDGHISKAGGLSLKLAAASEAHIRHVIVPDEYDPDDPEWETPFLMRVSPVNSLQQAYHTFTGIPIAGSRP
jgi:hypothetical protein